MRFLSCLTTGAALLSVSAAWAFPGIPGVKLNLPGPVGYTPGSSVTTSINDAFPLAPWLDGVENQMPCQERASFNLKPGYYRWTVQSYCLHAGAHAPTKGSGYLMAPLKGDRASLIKSILDRSVDHPAIAQQDVQQLIWGIEAGVKFSDYPGDFQQRVQPLLTPKDIAGLNVDISGSISKLLPGPAQDAMSFYESFRQKIMDPQESFQDLEKIAVLPPEVQPPDNSKNINPGAWGCIGNGFYMRALPENYTTTVMEVIRPAPYTLQRDAKGRIITFDSAGYHIDATYNDDPGQDILSQPGMPDVHVWRFRRVHLAGPDPGHDLVIDNTGWVVPATAIAFLPEPLPDPTRLADYSRDLQPEIHTAVAKGPVSDYYNRIAHFRGFMASVLLCKAGGGGGGGGGGGNCPSAGPDLGSLKHFNDGMNAATDPGAVKGKATWIFNTLAAVTNAGNQAAGALAGQSPCNPAPGPQPFNPNGNVAAPANPGSQRLAMSGRGHN